jgi:hypothetical protein
MRLHRGGRMGFYRVVVSNQSDQAAIGNPLLQSLIATV